MTPRMGGLIGISLMILGVIGTMAWLMVSFGRLDDDVARYPRVEALSKEAVRLQARRYTLYLVGEGSVENTHPLKIVMTHRRSGRRVSAKPYEGSFAHEGDEVMAAQATVTPAEAGVYDVVTDGHDDLALFQLAFGDKLDGRGLRILLFAGIIVVVPGIAGLALMLASGAWRRRGHRPQGWL